MTYYKGCSAPINWEDAIVKEYLNGYYLTKDKYGSKLKKPLTSRINKYNKEILIHAKELETDYKFLIMIESMFIHLTEQYSPKNANFTQNIWRIIVAQKGTAKYLYLLQKALKTYGITQKKLYDALIFDIKKTTERRDRNKDFLAIWAHDCGLQKIVDVIRDDYDTDIFTHAANIAEEFSAQNLKFTNKAELFEERDNFYFQKIIDIASENGIDLSYEINKAHEISMENRKEINKRISEAKYNKRQSEKQKHADFITKEDNIKLFHVLESGNQGNQSETISLIGYKRLVNELKKRHGKLQYITIVHQTALKYLTDDDNESGTIYRAKFFSDNDNTIDDVLVKLQTNMPDAIIQKHQLAMPDKVLESITESDMTDSERLYVDTKQMIVNLLENPGISPYKTYALENLFINNSKIYWINLIIAKENVCKFASQPKYEFKTCNDISKAIFFDSKRKANEFVQCNLEDIIIEGKYEIHIGDMTYNGPMLMHDKIIPEAIKVKAKDLSDDITTCLQMQEMLTYFTSTAMIDKVQEPLAKYEQLQFIIAQSPDTDSKFKFVSNRIGDHMIHNMFNTCHQNKDTIHDNLYTTNLWHKILFASQKSKSECNQLQSCLKYLQKIDGHRKAYYIMNLFYNKQTNSVEITIAE